MVIRMISGALGLSYTDANGVPRFALKTPSSGWFEAPDGQAEALVKAGRAVAKDIAPAPQPKPQPVQEAAEVTETVDEEDGPDLSVSDVVLPEVPEKPARSRRKKK